MIVYNNKHETTKLLIINTIFFKFLNMKFIKSAAIDNVFRIISVIKSVELLIHRFN